MLRELWEPHRTDDLNRLCESVSNLGGLDAFLNSLEEAGLLVPLAASDQDSFKSKTGNVSPYVNISPEVQDIDFHEEEMARCMAPGPHGHGVPPGVPSHHTEPEWAISVMLSVLQRLRSHLPDTPMPTRNPIKFANQFVRHLVQLVREGGGLDAASETLDPSILKATLITWLQYKVHDCHWRKFSMTHDEILAAAHAVVSCLP